MTAPLYVVSTRVKQALPQRWIFEHQFGRDGGVEKEFNEMFNQPLSSFSNQLVSILPRINWKFLFHNLILLFSLIT